MVYRDGRLRPEMRTFEGDPRIVVVDGEQVLAAAAGRRVELLRSATFAPPIREVSLSVTRDPRPDHDVVLISGLVRAGGSQIPKIAVAALGSPLSVLLQHRLEAGDQWAVKVVGGVEAVTSQVVRRLRPTTEEPVAETLRAVERVDEATGLRIDVTYRSPRPETVVVDLRASVPGPEMDLERLHAVASALVAVVRELGGDVPAEITLSAGSSPDGDVTLDQIGGLSEIVARLRQVAESFRHPEAMARWGARRPQGVLFYGPPGTGKTMLARALAHEIGARFEEIHTPDILDKWLGGSERNIKDIFQRARRYTVPTVMLFDEFDSIISYTGAAGDSAGQAINAVAGIFKQEMNDLIDVNPLVIVVATTNFPERVDESLIRSGRFDVRVLVGKPTAEGRAEILAKMIRQRIAAHEIGEFQMYADDIDVDALAGLTAGMTGADLGELLRRAQMDKAMQEARTGDVPAAIDQVHLVRQIEQLRAEARSAAA
ncbi:MAG TPA: ATP-binding protein [Micromonosporaceae bacterium]